MVPENSNPFNGEDQPLRSGENGNDDRLQDASRSDSAAENARESERIQEASRAAATSYELDDQNNELRNADNADQQPPTTQGSDEEIEENLSGTTNLTLDQLKKERDPGGFSREGEDQEERTF